MDQLIYTLSIWSYVFLFGTVFFECAGLPLPGLSVAMLATALAGHGKLVLWIVVALTLAGLILGGMLGYWIGKRGGRGFLERNGRYFLITPYRFTSAEKLFQKHGSKAILFGRYFPFLCFLAGVLSGIANVQYRRFFWFNLAGALLWSVTQLPLAYVFGKSLNALTGAINNITLVTGLGLVFFVFAYIALRKFQVYRRAAHLFKVSGKDL